MILEYCRQIGRASCREQGLILVEMEVVVEVEVEGQGVRAVFQPP